MLEQLGSWDFDSLGKSPGELRQIPTVIVESLGILKEIGVTNEKFQTFMMAVQCLYEDNPFHNFHHAMDVTQAVYFLLVKTKIASRMSKQNITAMVLAAICHDLDHPGQSNGFQIRERNTLALRYNDISVLENHHCAVAFEILLDKEAGGLLSGVPADYFCELRKQIISCILATDMAKHFDIVTKFEETVKVKGPNAFVEDEECKLLLMQMVIKCADISNPSRPWYVAERWNDRVIEEFYNEGDLDIEKGREALPHMNRKKNDPKKSTAGFVENVVVPLFSAFHSFVEAAPWCDSGFSNVPVGNLQKNLGEIAASKKLERK